MSIVTEKREDHTCDTPWIEGINRMDKIGPTWFLILSEEYL